MATAIGKVAAVFTASTSGLTTGVNQAGKSMNRLEKDVKGLRSGMRLLTAIQGAQLFGQITAGVSRAVSSFLDMAGAQAQVIDRQSKLAARLGFTDAQLAAVSLAGELAGVSMEQVANAATKMNITLGRAASGSKASRAAFESIGLSFGDLQNMSPDEQFAAIAQAISMLPDEAAQAAAAVAIFGRSGAELLPMFQGGAAGIQAAREQAERLGLALTNAQADDVEAMNDAFTLAQKAISGVVQQVVAYLAPAAKAVADTFTNFVGDIGGANIGQAIGDALLQGAQFFAGIADAVIANFGTVFDYAAGVAASWFDTFSFAGSIASAFLGVGRLLQTIFLGVVRTALTPLMFVIEQAANLLSYVPGIGSTAEAVAATVSGFRSGLDASIAENASATAENFGNAIDGTAAGFGEAAAGPFSSMLAEARARALEAANQTSQQPAAAAAAAAAGPQAVAPQPAAASTEALKAIDSTSREGIAEMFRLMRGDGGNVQEQQLGVLEQIRDSIQEQGDGGYDATELVFGGA